MMLKARLFDISLFTISMALAFSYGHIHIERNIFVEALLVYWLFSILYYHFRILRKINNTSVDVGISYNLSFAIFAGPLGLFIYETIYGLTTYIYKKWMKTAEPGEFLDTFYNIGSFTLGNIAVYYLYYMFIPFFETIPYLGFWILMFVLSFVSYLLSVTFLMTVFFILGEIKTLREAMDFAIKSRSLLDLGKIALSNGLLLIFLQEGKWDILIGLFLLNYLVSRSFYMKSQSIQDKLERDQFEQMAYTDFLTGVYNRAFMDKKMSEINKTESESSIGIVVADIDHFKSINDTYNHAVGDKVIQHFATLLKDTITNEDFLFRSGGEEFTIILRKRTYEETVAVVKQMLEELRRSSVKITHEGKTKMITYTSSFGLYYYQIDENIPMEKGYIMADELLLQSKQSGKNRFTSIKE